MAPLAAAPVAQADEFDWLTDLFEPWFGAAPVAESVDLGDPGMTTWWDSSAWSWLDLSTWGDQVSGSALGTEPLAFNAWFDANVYAPIHTGIEEWINSSDGLQFAAFVNQISGLYLIGDGADGTALDPNGGDAGLLFGDGGDGYFGGSGGDAGWLIGNGGDAGGGAPDSGVQLLALGDPVNGAVGTAGNAAFLFGHGGAGGDGADGEFGGNGGDGGAGGAGGLFWGNGGA
ncbi:hypothetical protein BST28_22530, partial [Mycolicibacter kumamotonensis]